jgi:hypothetical protein
MLNNSITNTVDEITEKINPKNMSKIKSEKRELLITEPIHVSAFLLVYQTIIDYVSKYPGAKIYIISPQECSLRINMSAMDYKLGENRIFDYKIKEKDCEFHLENGSVICFRKIQSKKDFGKFRSINADMIYLTNGCEFTSRIYDFASSDWKETSIEWKEDISEEEFYDFYHSDLLMRLGRGPACQNQGADSKIIVHTIPGSMSSWIYRHFYEFEDCHGDWALIKRMKEYRGIYIVE